MTANAWIPNRRWVLAGAVAAGSPVQASASIDPGAAKVARQLAPAYQVAGREPIRWSLTERLRLHRTPGVSLAVIDRGRIVWAAGFGARSANNASRVTPHTLFQAASISKVIAATAVVRLAEAGRLDLDADVNRYLTAWRVPESTFDSQQKVTLRRILSHRAGLTVHGFSGYGPEELKPTILDVLEGRPPAHNAPVRVDVIPGQVTRYSGGGVTVEQLLLTEVLRKPFPELMRTLVLDPLGMADSSFAQPLARAHLAQVAPGHDADGKILQGGWAIGPEMAAGWLWSTPTDLCRWAIAVAEARAGRRRGFLSRVIADQMLTPQEGGVYGLGPLLEGEGRSFRFGHGGNNRGYRAQVIYFPETRQGLAVMANADGADLMLDEIIRAVAVAYDWPALQPQIISAVALDAATGDRILGVYSVDLGGAEPTRAMVTHSGGRFFLDAPPIIEKDEIVAVQSGGFISPGIGYRISFDLTGAAAALGFTLSLNDVDMPATRLP